MGAKLMSRYVLLCILLDSITTTIAVGYLKLNELNPVYNYLWFNVFKNTDYYVIFLSGFIVSAVWLFLTFKLVKRFVKKPEQLTFMYGLIIGTYIMTIASNTAIIVKAL